jgi:quinol monooxygenase YgiN
MAKRLTIIKLKGDTDAILAQMDEGEHVIEKAARENGGVFHIRAKTDDGVIIANLWENEEGSDAVFQDPEVQKTLEAMQGVVQGPPERNHYEVEQYREV